MDFRELYVFANASDNAYASAIYLRGLRLSGEWQLSLLMAKTKVALKLKSISCFELCDAVLAAHLLQKVADELYIDRNILYATSELSWHG